MQELIVSNRKLMHIIAALDDQQKVRYPSQLKIMVQNFWRQIVRIYMHFDQHVIAEQGKSFLLFKKKLWIFIGYISVENEIMERHYRTRILLIMKNGFAENFWIAKHTNLQNPQNSMTE